MNVNSLSVNYDSENDVLYISFGDPVPSYVDDDHDGVLLRKAYSDDKYSGVTIFDFSTRNIKKLISQIPFQVDLESISSRMH